MGNNRKPGNKKIIKTNLKTSDRISVIYNNEEVEMFIEDFKTALGITSSTNRPYTIYSALLTQSGTNAPVVTVFENTIGDIVWTRKNVGWYKGTLVVAFPDSNTLLPNDIFISIDGSVSGLIQFQLESGSDDVIEIFTYDSGGSLADSLLKNLASGRPVEIEIRVYE